MFSKFKDLKPHYQSMVAVAIAFAAAAFYRDFVGLLDVFLGNVIVSYSSSIAIILFFIYSLFFSRGAIVYAAY